jgi:DNA-binding beta-propeller fold protein YncE
MFHRRSFIDPRTVVSAAAIALLMPCASAAEHSDTTPKFESRLFSLVGDFPLGRASNRVDYQSVDPDAKRLYVSMMGAGKLLVFDVAGNKPLRQLDGFPKITGVLVVPELHRVYASVPGAGLGSSVMVGLGVLGLSSGHGAVAVVDTDSLKVIARLPGGVFPDGIAFDPKDRRIFVSDELGSALSVIDADANRFVARIPAGGEVGNVRYEPRTSRIYAPVQTKNELAVFDSKKNVRLTAYPLAGCKHPHGLAIAPDAAIGYVACDENDVLLTVDLTTGKVLSHLPVAHDPDVLAIDVSAKRLYVAGESGNLSTYSIAAPASPVALGDTFVGADAHSVTVDPASHRLYFPIADLDGHSVMRVLTPKA